MKRRTLIASIGAVAGTTLGAAAYTRATVERSAEISVIADQNAHIQLTPGKFSQISEVEGKLSINFTKLNANSTFVFGDATGPAVEHAFSLSHLETASEGDINLEYVLDPDPSADTNVQFDIYTDDEAGTVENVATVNEDTPGTITSALSSETYYVVLTLDTSGATSTNPLSGTLSISA